MREVWAGADLGGTTIGVAVATAEGEVLAERCAPTCAYEGPRRVVERIADLLEQTVREAGVRPVALGLGVPGLADVNAGVTRFLPNLPTQWRDLPVSAWLAERLGCPVHLLNDVRIATLGELVFGWGRGRDRPTMAMFAIGTGIGGGVVVEGVLRLGPLGAAGELGHQTVVPDGPPCGCGSRGCLETVASGPAIRAEGVRLVASGLAPRLAEITGGDVGRITPETMAAAAREGDELVARAIERAARWLGIGVANIVTALHPDLVVLGGGVAGMGAQLLEPLRDEVRRRVRMFPVDTVQIELSRLGGRAGMLGGVALAMAGGARGLCARMQGEAQR
ncbi:MAG: ROK family protein [Kiritimatiellae bacterium]|nr:ROK family protein [Kiritimatiellia bacterium]